MKAEEKARELVYRFIPLVRQSDLHDTYVNKAEQCALICVEEIIKLLYEYPSLSEIVEQRQDNGHWQQVKTEIEKL